MFAKLFAVSALAILAAATPATQGSSPTGCSTGTLQCCSSTQSANSTSIAPILAGLGIVIQDVNALVGLGCSPVTGVGVGTGNACSADTVCCDNTALGGLLGVGCIPINA
ncbi:hydrophobin [Fomes fomentarius]|nr:hydrophobin [Fomes fomentarius]